MILSLSNYNVVPFWVSTRFMEKIASRASLKAKHRNRWATFFLLQYFTVLEKIATRCHSFFLQNLFALLFYYIVKCFSWYCKVLGSEYYLRQIFSYFDLCHFCIELKTLFLWDPCLMHAFPLPICDLIGVQYHIAAVVEAYSSWN
jgi:hypothetical protein